ncbi:PPOX class F420-dependent oxidoreductase [Amycolatopsis sp. NPDC051372]|uniref:PPOX class F420-dependent oxidoreductase n=1 Tax=Amycolatopsis sp. NPDC051372 TaxID=3155669 RepID=UPI003419ED5E
MSLLGELGKSHHVSLTTFRRDGRAVPTVLGVAVDDQGRVCMLTPPGSGKVKRLRNNARVRLSPSDGQGRIPDDASSGEGTARLADRDETARIRKLMTRKYLAARLVLWTDRFRPPHKHWIGIVVTIRTERSPRR